MTQTKFFIISSAIIFVLERALSIVAPWPIFIFPVFVVLFGLSSGGDILAYLPYLAIAALFFDFFSGLPFGRLTIAIIAVFITIHLARSFLSIGGRSLVFTSAISLVFVFEYFFFLSIKTPRLIISQAPIILVETIILLIFMRAVFRKVNSPSSNFAG